MNSRWTEHFEWTFPGGIIGLSLALFLGILLVALSYRNTLRSIPLHARIILALLRTSLIGLIIFCLCQPTQIRKELSANERKPKIAVIFDESDSMKIPTPLGQTRLTRAIQYHKETLSKYKDACDMQYFAFAENFRPLKDPGDLLQKYEKTGMTSLYGSLSQWSEQLSREKFEGVISLTDGIDTSEIEQQIALQALEQNSLRHAFVAVTSTLSSSPFVQIKKVEVPSSVRASSTVPVSMLLQTAGIPDDLPLTVEVREGSELVHKEILRRLGKNSSLQPCNFTLPLVKTGTHVYKAAVQSGGETLAFTTWSVEALADEKLQVLLYVGAMDWLRYLRIVFDRRDLVDLDVKIAPNAPSQNTAPTSINDNFPTASECQKFQALILLNLSPNQITPETAKNLKSYLKNGGSILYTTSNPAITSQIPSSSLAELLPVEFEAIRENNTQDFTENAQDFLNSVRQIRPRNKQQSNNHSTEPHISPFHLTPEGIQSSIFNFAIKDKVVVDELLPRFETSAPISRAKPGAQILALDSIPQGKTNPGILLASQQYGRGRSVVLATDILYGWRMAKKYDPALFDQFWQNLVSWLGAGRSQKPFWIIPSTIQPAGRPVELLLEIPVSCDLNVQKLKCSITDFQGAQPLTLSPTKEATQYKTTAILKPGETHHVVAKMNNDIVAQCYISGDIKPADREKHLLKPDLENLETLAAAAHGVVVEIDRKFDWSSWFPKPEPLVLQEIKKPLWHETWIFLLMLGLFCGEMLLRRKYKLL